MKKILSVFIACALCMTQAVPAFAYSAAFAQSHIAQGGNYNFSTGEGAIPGFGNSTSNDDPVSPDPMSRNERRNKDNSALPPPYFYGSGDIPTESSSLYHDNLPGNAVNGYGGVSGNFGVPIAQGSTSAIPPAPGPYGSTSVATAVTEPKYYADGSIGSIYVARTKKTVSVYEGESPDNLKKGAGHFTSTGIWDGNVSLCGHNRGNWPYFSFVKNLSIGDKITYTTLYGTRVYEVFSKEQIDEYDYSKLGRSSENLLTLVTCVENTPGLRFAAQCREVR